MAALLMLPSRRLIGTSVLRWPATACCYRHCCPPSNRKSWYCTDAHDPDRTTVHVLNNELKDRLLINTFSEVGFRLNIGLVVVGSIVLFPQAVLAWAVASSSDVNEASTSLLHVIEPKLDIVVIGFGDRGRRIDPAVIQSLSRRRIYVEALPTEQACTTYNFLAAEDRHVAALLIPPTVLRTTDDDLIEQRIKQKRLFKMDLLNESE